MRRTGIAFLAAALAVTAAAGCDAAQGRGAGGSRARHVPALVMNRPWLIRTIAGGPGGPATQQMLEPPCAMAAADGSLYLAAAGSAGGIPVFKVSGVTGRLTTVAGFGEGGFSPDGTLAASARLGVVCGLAVDGAGNVVLADSDEFTNAGDAHSPLGMLGNHRIRVVASRTGVFYGRPMRAGRIYTIAGNGGRGFGGDGGPARSAELYYPGAVAVDQAGNVVVADVGNDRIRVIGARSGTFYGVPMQAGDIYTVAGSGPAPLAGARNYSARAVVPGSLALHAVLRLEDTGADNLYSALAIDHQGDIIFDNTYALPPPIPGGLLLLAGHTGQAFGRPVRAGHLYPIANLGAVAALAVDSAGNVLAARLGGPPAVIAAATGTFYGQRMSAGHSYRLPQPPGAPPLVVQVAADAAGNLFEAYGGPFRGAGGGEVWMRAIRSGRVYGQPMSAGRFALVAGLRAAGSAGPAGQAGLPDIGLVVPDGLPAGWAGTFVPANLAANRMVMAAPGTGTWFGQPMIAGHLYAIAGNGQNTGLTKDGALATGTALPGWESTLTEDHAGNVLFADEFGGHVWAIAARSGVFYGRQMAAGHIYSVVAGPGVRQPGVRAGVCRGGIGQVTADRAGNLVIGCGFDGLLVLAARSGTFYGQVMRAGHLYPLHQPAQSESGGLSVDHFGNLITLAYGRHPQVQVIAPDTGLFYGQRMRAGHFYTIVPRPIAGIATDPWGNVLLASTSSQHPRVEVVAGRSGTYYGQPMLAGHIYTIAGSGPPGFGGDGGPAARASLDHPTTIAFWPGHGVLVGDSGKVRLIYPPSQ
jgi:NHL repeat